MESVRPEKHYSTLGLFTGLLLLMTSLVSASGVMAQDVTEVRQSPQRSDSSTQGAAYFVAREAFGTTRVVELSTIQPGTAAPYEITPDDQMLLHKLYVMNGLFSDQTFNTGGVELRTPGGLFHFFYLDRYERQEHTFDPPILIEPGATIDFFGPDSNVDTFLQITLVGTLDPEVFADRFEDGAATASDPSAD